MNTVDFLKYIFDNDIINFRCMKPIKNQKPINKTVNGVSDKHTIGILKQFNEQGFNVYFAPNAGGYKDADITKINAVFVDLDCGRDSNGNYFPLNIVDKFKFDKLQAIQDFWFKPTFIVETRNGYHVYWLVNDSATVDQFKECELRLIKHFNADRSVRNPANLMRVPGFHWCKDVNSKFLVNVIAFSDVRYDIEEIANSLPEVKNANGDLGTHNKKKFNTLLFIDGTTNPCSTNIRMIREQNMIALQEILKPETISFTSHLEVYDYLKTRPLNTFLGLNSNWFNCIFHDDASPSAGIIVNAETGHHIYSCNSGSCGFKGTIIQVVEQLTGLDRVQALRFLRKVYKVNYVETEWQKEKKAILEENRRFITSHEFKDFYPEIYSLVRDYIPELYLLNGIAREKVSTEKFTNSSGNPLFFASSRYVASQCGKDTKTTGLRLAIFAYLGLVKKLGQDEVPDFLLNRAKTEAKKKNRKNTISFFSIPSYCSSTLAESTQKAKEFKEAGLRKKGFGREMLLRTFGPEEANRVYPQMCNQPVSGLNEKVSSEIEKTVCKMVFNDKGWTTEAEILDSLNLSFRGAKRFKETQLQRCLPEILQKYCLQKVRSNKRLKQQFGIAGNGYPVIIVPEG